MAIKNREERHAAIRDIVRTSRMRTQHDLVAELKNRGFICTQATISRDITELGLRKLPEGVYVLREDLHLQRMVRDLVTEVACTGNLVVIKSSAGTAAAVAAALDAAALPGVMGSIAGDDTILVIAVDEGQALSFQQALDGLRF